MDSDEILDRKTTQIIINVNELALLRVYFDKFLNWEFSFKGQAAWGYKGICGLGDSAFGIGRLGSPQVLKVVF